VYPTKMPSAPQRSGFTRSVDAIAVVIAMIATFFAAPIFFSVTIGPVTNFTIERYGLDAESLAVLLWMGLSGLLVFFTIQAATTVALMRLGIASLMGR